MGYTHYWYLPPVIDRPTFKKIVDDFKKLIPEFESLGIKLAGAGGKGKPKLTSEKVIFNGSNNCGHPENLLITIPWPTDNAKGIAEDNTSAIKGNWFAGTLLNARACDGSCSYESFYIERRCDDEKAIIQKDSADDPREINKRFGFCKTAYRPYDFAVICFLVIAKHYLGENIIVRTDGTNSQWDCFDFLQEKLGYGKEYYVTESGELVKV